MRITKTMRRQWGRKGARVAFHNMSRQQRVDRARKAVAARWDRTRRVDLGDLVREIQS